MARLGRHGFRLRCPLIGVMRPPTDASALVRRTRIQPHDRDGRSAQADARAVDQTVGRLRSFCRTICDMLTSAGIFYLKSLGASCLTRTRWTCTTSV
jgi:hypothetical protein